MRILRGCSAIVGLVVVACSATPRGTDGGPSTSAASSYEVHEWGLIRGAPGDVLTLGAVAPLAPVEPTVADKPLLYFHADGPVTLNEVSVSTPGGSVLETWPLAQIGAGNASLSWSDVSLHPSSLCEPSPLPGAGDAPCSTLPAGSFCESAGLATVRTDDAACVRFGDSVDRFLFYRAASRSFTLPLRFSRTKVYEDVLVMNDGDLPIPGVLVRISSDGGSTRTLIAKPPAPHASAIIGHDFDKTVSSDGKAAFNGLAIADDKTVMDESIPRRTLFGPGRDGIRSTMRELGMTQPEIDAFVRAWDAALFGGQPVVDEDRRSSDGERAARETFVYFLPVESIDGIAKLHFDPAPRAVKRAFAVWSVLRPVGESR